MPSTYPGALDSWPGSPYVDGTEYMDASYANYWISAMTAIETTIGYGSGSTAANPLYSTTYGLSYATVTARIAAIEATVVGSSKLNTAAGNIGPISTTATAGSTGLGADAGHGHEGVLRVLAGTNITVASTDSAGHGTVTISAANAGVSEVLAGAGISLSGSTGNVTISATGSLPNAGTGNVQPVGTADAAGSSGLLPDAAHIHQGVTSIASTGYGTVVNTTDGIGHGAAQVGVALTYSAGVLLTPYMYIESTSFVPFFSTASLGVGTWLVNFTVCWDPVYPDGPGGTVCYSDIQIQTGTAVASFQGPQALEVSIAGYAGVFNNSLSTIAVITTAGTLSWATKYYANGGGLTFGTIWSGAPEGGEGNVTGYTALRVQ